MSWNPIPGPLVASPRRWGPRFSPAQLPVFGGGLTLTLFCYRFFSTWEDLGCPPVGRQGSAMKRAAMRLWTLNKGLLTHGRGLSQGSQYKISEPLHIHQVQVKLREIVGISTVWRDHVQAMEERKLLHSFLPKSQKVLPPRKIRDSYIEVLLPLGTDPELRDKYVTVQNTVR